MQGGPYPGQDALPLQGTSHTPHTHVDWDSADMCTALECGRKPEYPGKTLTHMGRMYTLQKDSGPSWESMFFPFQCYNETMLNKTLLKDLLYMEKVLQLIIS